MMNKYEHAARLALVEQAVLDLPDGLYPRTVWIDGDRHTRKPVLMVYEHSDTCPDIFIQYCDSLNKQPVTYAHDEDYDEMSVTLDTGVCINILIVRFKYKEDQPND